MWPSVRDTWLSNFSCKDTRSRLSWNLLKKKTFCPRESCREVRRCKKSATRWQVMWDLWDEIEVCSVPISVYFCYFYKCKMQWQLNSSGSRKISHDRAGLSILNILPGILFVSNHCCQCSLTFRHYHIKYILYKNVIWLFSCIPVNNLNDLLHPKVDHIVPNGILNMKPVKHINRLKRHGCRHPITVPHQLSNMMKVTI